MNLEEEILKLTDEIALLKQEVVKLRQFVDNLALILGSNNNLIHRIIHKMEMRDE